MWTRHTLTYYTILEITSGYEQCQETSMIEWCISDIDSSNFEN